MPDEMTTYYGQDEPSASFKWGVVVPVDTVVNDPPFNTRRAKWCAVAWFRTRKRAVEYAKSGWSNYAIARMK